MGQRTRNLQITSRLLRLFWPRFCYWGLSTGTEKISPDFSCSSFLLWSHQRKNGVLHFRCSSVSDFDDGFANTPAPEAITIPAWTDSATALDC